MSVYSSLSTTGRWQVHILAVTIPKASISSRGIVREVQGDYIIVDRKMKSSERADSVFFSR